MVKASLLFTAAAFLATLPTLAIADPILPCATGTIATVMAQGPCTIGDTDFHFTSYIATHIGNVSSPNSATDITFMPLAGDPLNPGFRLTDHFESTAGDYTNETGALFYDVSVTEGSIIGNNVKGNNRMVTAAAAPGADALAEAVIETYNFLYSSGLPVTQFIWAFQNSDEPLNNRFIDTGPRMFAPVLSSSGIAAFGTYAYDYSYRTLTYGGSGSAQATMSSVDYTILEQTAPPPPPPPPPVPEPSTGLLFGTVGVILMAVTPGLRRKLSR